MNGTFWGVGSATVKSNLGVKLTRLLRKTGNSALEADLPPNQKKTVHFFFSGFTTILSPVFDSYRFHIDKKI